MEQNQTSKRSKLNQQNALTQPVRVTPETRKQLSKLLALANRKEFGRRVKSNDVIALALLLVENRHIEELKEKSLSNADRFEKLFHDHCKQHGKVSRDEFLGLLMTREVGGEGNSLITG